MRTRSWQSLFAIGGGAALVTMLLALALPGADSQPKDNADRIKPGDAIHLVFSEESNTFLNDIYIVNASGKLRVTPGTEISVAGMTIDEANKEGAKQILFSRYAPAANDPAYPRVRIGDRLCIEVAGTLPDQPIKNVYLVEPSGKVALGPLYGRADVAGSTLEEAQARVRNQLMEILQAPRVTVTWYDPISQSESSRNEKIVKLEQELIELRATVKQISKQ